MENNYSHLTAKERDKISFPTHWLMENHLLKGEILDFGCGFGTDVKGLNKLKYSIDGYDKYYHPNYPLKQYDTIFCHYVLNILHSHEQHEIIMEISQLLKPNGIAYFTVRRDIKKDGYRIHKVHKQPTYQCNVILPFESVFVNEFCEIYVFRRVVDQQKETLCIFCQPAPTLKYIAESTTAFAVFDGFPVSKGHCLIIPKRHVANYFELTQKEQFHLIILSNFVQRYLQKEFNPDGFNLGININAAAGQTIEHVHVHLIPRYQGDVENPIGGIRHVIPGKGFYQPND